MPYIDQHRRDQVEPAIKALAEEIGCVGDAEIDGVMNYVISTLVQRVYYPGQPRYSTMQRVAGLLACVQLEHYRRVAAPYEDAKEREPGRVW